jgi:glucosylceramidase
VATAVKNPDESIAVAIFNPTETKQTIEIQLNNNKTIISIDGQALQTVVLKSN